ncbi:MAG: lycopene cyclase domain-containing protein [Ignavibacteriae bacterium]|nr:lycopene cyclase domain-containing protein [Ignavibacteriota bacterium]MCB9217310.1 lycopene cyclase domain-containing protein [Ignavibacteria bacterium]
MEKTTYLYHLLFWMLPVIAIQWSIGWRIFLRNRKAVFIPPLIFGTYYSLTDLVAVGEGIWFFDENQIVGLKAGPLPIEEILFFFITALLVSQSIVMLVPKKYRDS